MKSLFFIPLLILNVCFIAANVYKLMNLSAFSRSQGPQSNMAGAIMIILMVAGVYAVIHLIILGIVLYNKSTVLLNSVSIITGILTILLFSADEVSRLSDVRKRKEEEQQQQLAGQQAVQRMEDYNKGIGISDDPRHTQFTMAIAANDSSKVQSMIASGEKVIQEDLKLAVDLVFNENKTIAHTIFDMILANGGDAKQDDIMRTALRNCENDKQTPVVQILLNAGGNPLPNGEFPLTCLSKVKLVIRHGGNINALRTVTDNYIYALDIDKSLINYQPNWTPIMIYLRAYPDYFQETVFLLENSPDLDYKDENGYSLKHILKELTDRLSSEQRPIPEELIALDKKLKKT